MNVFGDDEAAGKLRQIKAAISGLTGQDLAQQPDVAAKLAEACQVLRSQMLAGQRQPAYRAAEEKGGAGIAREYSAVSAL